MLYCTVVNTVLMYHVSHALSMNQMIIDNFDALARVNKRAFVTALSAITKNLLAVVRYRKFVSISLLYWFFHLCVLISICIVSLQLINTLL